MAPRAATALLLAAILPACGGGAPAAPSPPAAPGGTHASAHFLFHYTALDAGNIASIAGSVEAEHRFGAAALPALVAAHGDTAAVLGVPLAEFESEWFAFTRERYAF